MYVGELTACVHVYLQKVLYYGRGRYRRYHFEYCSLLISMSNSRVKAAPIQSGFMKCCHASLISKCWRTPKVCHHALTFQACTAFTTEGRALNIVLLFLYYALPLVALLRHAP